MVPLQFIDCFRSSIANHDCSAASPYELSLRNCRVIQQSKDRVRPIGTPNLSSVSSRLEHFAPAHHLRVLRIFDFQPRRGDAVCFVSTIAPFTNDALKITATRSPKEIDATPRQG